MIDAPRELLPIIHQLIEGNSRFFRQQVEGIHALHFDFDNHAERSDADRHPGALPVLTKTRTQHYPLGAVGLISPWNYPLSLGVGDVLAALSAGNAVVHKPDSQTTLTAILLRRLAIEAGLSRGCLAAGSRPRSGGGRCPRSTGG